MGGGGVTYISDYSSNFLNPANLLIPDHTLKVQIGLGRIGVFLNNKPLETQRNPIRAFSDVFSPNKKDITVTNQLFTSAQNVAAISNWFPDNTQVYSKKAQYNALLFGLSWQKRHYAFSLAIRTRGINHIDVGRGWYDTNFVQSDTTGILNRSVNQTISVFHEISFGYAQELSLVNGWTSKLNRLYFGIAPKLVIAGMYFNGQYNSRYIRDNSGTVNQRSFNSISTGALSNNLGTYNLNTNSFDYPSNSLSRMDLSQPTGFGAGLDMGLTYVMALGNDISLLRQGNSPVLKKSLRLSVSVTDIGFVKYYKNVRHYYSKPVETSANAIPDVPHSDFIGSPGMFSRFIAADDPSGTSYNSSNLVQETKMNISLPTSLHIGSAIQLPLFMATVDFTYALNQQAFNNKYIVTNIGGELQLIHFLPIRAGVQLEKGFSPIFGFGTALDLPHFEFSVGTQINTSGASHHTYMVGAGVAALKLRF